MAAPVGYDWPAIMNEVAEWLASGRTIRDYCRQEGKPHNSLVHQHIARDPEMVQRIARARAEGCDAIAEEALAIADDSSGDVLEAEEGTRCDTEFVQRSKLRFEARMRLMSKWNSGRYGDRQQVEHSGSLSLGDAIARTAARRAAEQSEPES